MRPFFPVHGLIGLGLLFVSEVLHLRKIEPFYSWFYCFAWWSYILAVDGVIFYLKGNSLIVSRTREFFLMIPWSIFFWLIFEAANLSLKNWYYVHLPNSALERWLGYAVAYGTVLPGLFETTELLETLGVFRRARIRRFILSLRGHLALVLLGGVCLILSVSSPGIFFPLIWVGFIFLLEPFNRFCGGGSLLHDLEEGRPGKIYLLLVAGFICGGLWEFWNFWARSKWVYTVPFFDQCKGFEMPYLGFLGFPPFCVQCYVMYNFVSLFRYRRGWEASTAEHPPYKRVRSLTKVLMAIFLICFYILVFGAIDEHTVDSTVPRLSDAYWIPISYRENLPRVGVTSLEDLLARTQATQEREELALRLLVPKEEFLRWIEKAELVRLKGLGIRNLRLLESVNIQTVAALAAADPDRLEAEMKRSGFSRPLPSKAKLRIWIREAKKTARGKS